MATRKKILNQAEAGSRLMEARFYHLYNYLIINTFSKFIVYYEEGQGRASFVAPEALLIRESERLVRRELKISREPWILSDGVLGLAVLGENGQELYQAENVDALLGRGEEQIYIKDFEGRLTPEDFRALGERFGFDAEAMFGELVEKYYLLPQGEVISKSLKDIRTNKLKWLDLAKLKIDRARHNELEQELAAIILQKTRTSDPVAERFCNKAGLFNFDKQGVNFQPLLGRGEHNVYFEFLIGNRYGSFTPYSFLDLLKNSELSARVFEELVKDLGILEHDGRLNPGKNPKSVTGLKCLPDRELLNGVVDILLRARPLTENDVKTMLASDKNLISEDLEEIRLMMNLEMFDYAEFMKLIHNLDRGEMDRYVRLCQGARVNQDIDNEIVKNRGILLADADGNILILITDPPTVSAPYYSFLLNYFRDCFPRAPGLKIGHAYCRPTPRNKQNLLHPAVLALQSMLNSSPS